MKSTTPQSATTTLEPPVGARLHQATVRFGDETALDSATFEVRPGVITGLLGRNGAGKTTALSLLASLRRPSEGTVEVDGVDPFEDALAMASVQLVRESGDVMGSSKLTDTLEYYAELRPHWDPDFAEHLLDTFEIDPKKSPDTLSRGKRSAVGAVIGLASRAPLTIFDEVYLGMDAPNRYAFYDALLADYAEHPRTIVLSSHLIEEVERLFEDLVILHRGEVLMAESAEEFRARGVCLTGPTTTVHALAGARRVLAEQSLGSVTRVTLDGSLDDSESAAAHAAGVEIDAVSIQDLFVHLTHQERT